MNASSSQSASPSYFILATAGHVDHGKSALVKALTGTDPDRLLEEKARGITIDLGFAHLDLPGRGSHPGGIHLGIVDVPGHEDFISNMVAGVGLIDAALLVVAADDGWMPQTEEHLQILCYLGVARALVALTKSDAAGADLPGVAARVRERLLATPFAAAPILSTSALRGDGIGELKAALGQVIECAAPQRNFGKPRLAIDRAFNLRGIGPVVTGTLAGGAFERGQPVVIQPTGQRTRIRTIQSQNQELESIGPGRRTGLGLPDVAVAGKGRGGAQAGGQVRRGQVVTLPEFGQAALTIDVLLTRSARSIRPTRSGGLLLIENGSRVRIHHGTCRIAARIQFASGQALPPGGTGIGRLRLESPLFAFAGDAFIVRDCAEKTTLAGGTVLDSQADRRGFRNPRQQVFLQNQTAALQTAVSSLENWFRRDSLFPRSTLLLRAPFSAAEIAGAVEQLQSRDQLVVCGEMVCEAACWERLKRRVAEAIDAHHQAHPEQVGLSLTEMRAVLALQLPEAASLDELLPDLLAPEFIQVGTVVKRVTHGPALPPWLKGAVASIRDSLSAEPLDPPSRKVLATSSHGREALRFMLITGQAVEIGPKIVLLAEAHERAVALIRAHLSTHGTASVSELRQVLGTSRRVMVPLLETLDREGVTQRQGDLRMLRSPPPPFFTRL